MEALQIMPVMAQRRNCNLGEFAEDATVVTDDTDQYYRAGRIHSLLHDRWFHADNRIFLVYRTDRDAGRTDAVQCSSGEQDRKNDTDNKTKLYLSAAVKAADFFR